MRKHFSHTKTPYYQCGVFDWMNVFDSNAVCSLARKIHQSNLVTLVLLGISGMRPTSQSMFACAPSLGLGLQHHCVSKRVCGSKCFVMYIGRCRHGGRLYMRINVFEMNKNKCRHGGRPYNVSYGFTVYKGECRSRWSTLQRYKRRCDV